jgi:esterase/lipase superfamily enzyme
MILSRRSTLAGLASTLGLAACGERGALFPARLPGGTPVEIFVATSRTPEESAVAFGRGRERSEIFGRFVVSVPPAREVGTVTFPKAMPPDPESEFFTLEAVRYPGEPSFLAAMNARLLAKPPAERTVSLFTHGFNTNFAEGVFRQAQMMHDFETPGVYAHYSWPSAAGVKAYAYDRESAIFARDGLQRTLEALAETQSRDMLVAAHSMGAMLLMEALRSMALAGSPRFFSKLRGVVLVSPDIDIDVFRAQAAPVAARGVAFIVFYSSRDRALLASAILRGGGSDRLGRIHDPAALDGLPVTLVDTSTAAGSDKLGHFALATSPAMITLVRGLNEQGERILQDAAYRQTPLEATLNVATGVAGAVTQPLTGAPYP